MGYMRFRRSIKLAPGVKLNVNKKSVSVTAGRRGAHVTVNSKGQRTTSVGIPGTGLSYRNTRTIARHSSQAASRPGRRRAARRSKTPMLHPVLLWLALLPLGFGCWAPLYASSRVNRPTARLAAVGGVAIFIAGLICLTISPADKTSVLGTIALSLWAASWIVSATAWLVLRADYRQARAQVAGRLAGGWGAVTPEPAHVQARQEHAGAPVPAGGVQAAPEVTGEPATFGPSSHDEQEHDVPRTSVRRDLLIQTRPVAWEQRLFASDLFLEMRRLEPLWRDYSDRLSSGKLEYLDHSQARNLFMLVLKGAGRTVGDLDKANDPAVQERAFGRPGDPGDPAEIQRFARMVTGRYAELLHAAGSLRSHVVPDEYDEPFELLAQWIGGPISQVREFVSKLVTDLDDIESRLANRRPDDQPFVIDATLAVSLDESLRARLTDAIRRTSA